MTLLIVTALSVVGLAEENKIKVVTNASNDAGEIITVGNDDILDQSNSECVSGGMMVTGYTKYAQSFKPSLSILTRIEIYLVKKGNGGWTTYTADIRSTLDGSNLASVSNGVYSFPSGSNWVEFDFSDISIVTGQTYYIVCTPDGDHHDVDNYLMWSYGHPDPYDRGDAWKYDDDWEKLAPGGTPYDFCFKTYGLNLPPNQPGIPSGQSSGKAGNSYTYSSSTNDPDGHKVHYLFDWDDGTDSGWKGPYNSGETCEASHVWTAEGSYSIKVKAKDEYDVESDWSDSLSISMPKSKTINSQGLFEDGNIGFMLVIGDFTEEETRYTGHFSFMLFIGFVDGEFKFYTVHDEMMVLEKSLIQKEILITLTLSH